MNAVQLIGRLTSNPELKRTQSGIACCRFTIAVNRKFKNKNTGEYDADFITCLSWRQTAEFVAQHFVKGKMIALTGCLQTGSYQDRNHPDVTHYTTDVIVDNVEFCGDKNNSQQAQVAQTVRPNQNTTPESQYMDLSEFEEILSDGDVPF